MKKNPDHIIAYAPKLQRLELAMQVEITDGELFLGDNKIGTVNQAMFFEEYERDPVFPQLWHKIT